MLSKLLGRKFNPPLHLLCLRAEGQTNPIMPPVSLVQATDDNHVKTQPLRLVHGHDPNDF